MFRFLVRLCRWLKSWFKRNESPAVAAPIPTSQKPELSDLEYENLLLELLEEVVQGSNWGEIQGFLFGKNLEPEKLASWLRKFGQRWLLQPESHQELGHRLLLLSKLAKGELREVTRELGEKIYIVKTEDEEVENANAFNNSSSATPPQSSEQIPQNSVETVEVKLKPDFYEAWLFRALLLSELGRKEEAVASYDQALKLKPDDYQAWYNRGIAAYGSLNRNLYIQQEFVGLFCSEGSHVAQRIILSFEKVDSSQTIAQLKTSLDKSQDVLIKTFDDDDSIKLTEQINQAPSEELYQLIQQPITQKLIDLIQQPVSAKVVAQLEQDLFSHPHRSNPQLNLRGYQGQIASLEAELDRKIKKDTHPPGWGILHHGIGKAHYFEGCLNSAPFDYWHKAVTSYNRALETLTEADYPESHLEVLQNLIKVQLGLGETEQADQLRLIGLEILKNLLNSTPSFTAKKNLELKFIAFQQLNVDILINQGQLIEALTSAELSKNICLNNLLNTWQEPTVCPSYEQIQELLTPERAIIYWHLSPQSLNTFIIKANISEPIIISKSLEQQQDKAQLPHSLQRLQDYKNWLKEWNRQYQDYREKNKRVAEKDRRNHIWRKEMGERNLRWRIGR